MLMTLHEADLVDSRHNGLQVNYRLYDPQITQLLNLTPGTIRQTTTPNT